MSEPFLILHKVRGEPAFDVAECIGQETNGTDIWIIPTSGHRAYPYNRWPLSEIVDASDINVNGLHNRPYYMDDIPADWPDHYEPRPSKESNKPSMLGELLRKIGRAPDRERRRA